MGVRFVDLEQEGRSERVRHIVVYTCVEWRFDCCTCVEGVCGQF